ncbi:MAG TPA: ATP-binding protein [Planctomycetota bacterium]|nr:ATP-binding protein [Planctomycetota bacterium]
MLASIQEVQASFQASSDPRELHADWLARVLALTGATGGCSAEVGHGAEGPAWTVFALAPAPSAAEDAAARPSALAEFGAVFARLLESRKAFFADAQGGAQPLLALPLCRADGVQGAIVAVGPGRDERLAAALEPFLSTCAGLIEARRAARVRAEQQRSTLQLAHERAVLERVARMDSLENVLDALVRGHEALFPRTLGSVLLLDEEGEMLFKCAAPSLPEEYRYAIDGVDVGAGVGSSAAHSRHTVVVTDIDTDPRWARFSEIARRFELRSCWSTPILSAQGCVLGTFALYGREPRAPEPHELEAIESSARIAALAIERQRAEKASRNAAERLALATKSAQMGIFDYDIESGRLVWDEQMLAIYGVSASEFQGNYGAWRERVHPDDLQAAENGVNSSIEGTRPFEATFRILRPDGTIRFLEAATIMQRDASGRATRMTGVNIDVTEKKQLEAQALRSQRLESVGRLAGGLAHDLNNMLSPMLVGPSMLRDSVQTREGKSLLDTIESSAQRAASIIRQLLTFSRGTEGERAPTDCSTIIDDMLQIVHETFPRNIKAKRSGSAASWTVIGDATQLHQVLMNLCVNSRDEMPQGGTLDLRIENVEVDAQLAHSHGARPGKFVTIAVIDDGRGIDPKHMDRLFDPFFTTKGVGVGTGLGLATVRGIVKAHGGFVQVQTQLGRGSEFKVFLPAAPAEIPVVGPRIREPNPRGQGELVLVVDDEESIRRVTRAMLERSGYRVLLATSGEEALALHRAHQGELKLILTDLMMPGMNGETLVRLVRAADPAVRLILMSGDVGVNGQDVAMTTLVHGMLEKPFTMAGILRSMNRALVPQRAS